MIKRKGSKYCVYSGDGSKVLGCHHSKSGAIDQLQAVEASKARKRKTGHY